MKLHDVILQTMAGQLGNDLTPVEYQVYGPVTLVALVLAGMLVAVVGAYIPARWAAKALVAAVLHAE